MKRGSTNAVVDGWAGAGSARIGADVELDTGRPICGFSGCGARSSVLWSERRCLSPVILGSGFDEDDVDVDAVVVVDDVAAEMAILDSDWDVVAKDDVLIFGSRSREAEGTAKPFFACLSKACRFIDLVLSSSAKEGVAHEGARLDRTSSNGVDIFPSVSRILCATSDRRSPPPSPTRRRFAALCPVEVEEAPHPGKAAAAGCGNEGC